MDLSEFLCNIDYSFEEKSVDLHENCRLKNIERVKELIEQNVSIYSVDLGKRSAVMVATTAKKQSLVNIFLDIYERDLGFLNERSLTRSLVAMPDDHTSEFLMTVEHESSADAIPVLVKTSNADVPTCVYLRKTLKDKNDPSLRVAKKLEAKNGWCDLNWQTNNYRPGSVLHHALSLNMTNIVDRLLKIPTVDKNLINCDGESLLHFAVLYNNFKAVEAIEPDPRKIADDISLITYSIRSGSLKMIEFIINEFVESGKYSLKEIVRMNVSNDKDSNSSVILLHHIAYYHRYDFFMKHKVPLDEEDFYITNSDGDNLLHLLMRDSVDKEKVKKKIGKFLMEKYPKLTIMKNNKGFLPLHDALASVGDHDFVDLMHAKAVEISGNDDIFCENYETVISCLDSARTFFYRMEPIVELFLDKLMNGKFHFFLKNYGLQMVHKFSEKVYFCFSQLQFILSLKIVKFDLNESFDGLNAYFRMLKCMEGMKCFDILYHYQPVEDFTVTDENGKSMFMYVCEANTNEDIFKAIIEKTPECIHHKTKNGSTCFHFLHQNPCCKKLVDLLLDAGADPLVMNELGEKPIAQAIKSNNLDMFLRLIALEPDETINQRYGVSQKTLLHMACESSCPEILTEILKRNVDFNISDSDGNTALHQMTKVGNCFTVQKLIREKKFSFNINHQDKNGDTLLFLVLSMHSLDTAVSIIEIFDEEIDVIIKNNKLETLSHKIASVLYLRDLLKILTNYPKFLEVFNDQMNEENFEGKTPLWLVADRYCNFNYETGMTAIVEYVTLENLRKSFYLFVNQIEGLKIIFSKHPDFFGEKAVSFFNTSVDLMNNVEAFDYILTKITNLELLEVKVKGRNILHLFCATKNCDMIDSLIKFLTHQQLDLMMVEIDGDCRTPYELMDHETQQVFQILKTTFVVR